MEAMMMGSKNADGAVVVGPDVSPSYWQPMPANGFAEVRVSRNNGQGVAFSSGIQCIAPGSYIREHWHDHNEELLFFYEGTGCAIVDGIKHPIVPGTTIYLPPLAKHRLINEGEDNLMMMWTLLPGGLEDFFAAIGRPRTVGESAPVPFERPANVAEIERETVFGGAVQRSTARDETNAD